MTKRCSKCKETKDVSQFGKDKKSKDGFSYQCRACKAAIDRKYLENNRDQINERRSKRRADNGDHCRAQNAAWRAQARDRAAVCSVDGCQRKARYLKAGSMCNTHISRAHRHGDPDTVLTGPLRADWAGDEVGYSGAHNRVKRAHGPARDYTCEHCPNQAVDWAYDHTDPEPKYELIQWNGKLRELPYSPDPDRYLHLCKPCHISFDRAAARKRVSVDG